MLTFKTTAVIPARSGSKGIPMKNIAPLYGKPMLGWVIEEAKKSSFVSETIVSTDSDEIAAAAKAFGATVCMQPAELSGDFSTSDSAVLNVLLNKIENGDALPETTVLLHCSSPLMLAEDIDGTIRAMETTQSDCAFTVVPVYKYFWKTDETTGETIEDGHDRKFRQVRQKRNPKYLETGAVYAMRTQGFLENKTRLFGQTVMHETPYERFCDIDTRTDLTIAEVLMAEQVKNGLR